jgi:ubiquitin carboxyl-terminal hydrolase 10
MFIIQNEAVNTIRDALLGISHPQTVQMVSSSRPGTTVDASQQVTIDALPTILVLHLKRFLYDTNAKDVVKIGKNVQFTPELDIPAGT